jgi:DNA-binding MarR family transcriptional regulator
MSSYLKFTDQMRQIDEAFSLGHHELRLLDLAAQAYFSDQPILVRDLIFQKNIASQATLHACLKKLINKKLLTAKPHDQDGRQKNIVPTKLALDRYKKLHQAMRRAIN